MLITQLQSKVQDRGALDLPQVQEVQERFDKYRELAAAQLEEAKGKISRLEHQLDDRIIEADMAQNKAKEEMHCKARTDAGNFWQGNRNGLSILIRPFPA